MVPDGLDLGLRDRRPEPHDRTSAAGSIGAHSPLAPSAGRCATARSLQEPLDGRRPRVDDHRGQRDRRLVGPLDHPPGRPPAPAPAPRSSRLLPLPDEILEALVVARPAPGRARTASRRPPSPPRTTTSIRPDSTVTPSGSPESRRLERLDGHRDPDPRQPPPGGAPRPRSRTGTPAPAPGTFHSPALREPRPEEAPPSRVPELLEKRARIERLVRFPERDADEDSLSSTDRTAVRPRHRRRNASAGEPGGRKESAGRTAGRLVRREPCDQITK